MSRIRIVVADQAEAIFYDSTSLERPPKEVIRLADAAAHLHERDLRSDRPGRSHASGGGARHALDPVSQARKIEAARFARRIARRLDEARRRDEFDDLILVAGSRFLGMVRRELSKPTTARVVHEVAKDLVHSPVADLRRHLPQREDDFTRA
ncbi:MAG TPA: host attachment protein [Steroidobacteraceae bacterium]|nr:host attachment protein [Steroidobacteraceae bacterium]